MYFWCICGEEGDFHVLLLCHLEGPSDGWTSFRDSMLTTFHPPNPAKVTFNGNPLHNCLGLFSVVWTSSCASLLGLLHRVYFHLSRKPILDSLVTLIAGLWLLNHPSSQTIHPPFKTLPSTSPRRGFVQVEVHLLKWFYPSALQVHLYSPHVCQALPRTK